ncbi:UDP-glucose 4-epimerase GalE [Rickettsiella endosymbiont of Miltochrista miniata]|uniref:UDP-glucose 4-epimerase GalE n=1 Tax=Rickettsiella endosymbiont of Miltochrista miniata TaxID=3066239 RepID=UPI00313C8890
MNKNILITGGCGYIGSHITLLLKNHGFKIVVVDNLSTGQHNNMLEDVVYEIGDIGDSNFLEDVFNRHPIDIIMHLAAKTSVEESIHQSEFYYEENLLKSINLMKVCGRYTVKHFIFSSTAAVYGQNSYQTVCEKQLTNPNNPYGKSKYITELALSHLATEYAMQLTILRYFNVAGHDQSLRVGNFNRSSGALIPLICRNITIDKLPITIYGNDFDTPDGTCVRDYIHVMDIANAHVMAINQFNQLTVNKNLTLNVGYGKGLSVLEVVQLVNSLSDNTLNYIIGDRRSDDISYSVADNKRIQSLGWKSLFKDPYKEIITSELAWNKKLSTD